MRKAARFLMKLLRELSDENAYKRYLEVRGATHSGSEWRKFSEIRMREKYSRAKCC
jgi:hypothetical protein